jgi:hypothetical protein
VEDDIPKGRLHELINNEKQITKDRLGTSFFISPPWCVNENSAEYILYQIKKDISQDISSYY